MSNVALMRFFIVQIDAVGTKRYDSTSGGEREIQRTMLELLNQMDGFDSRGDVKVIMATNKIESLDPALLRPGRIDRKIEFPLPGTLSQRRIPLRTQCFESNFFTLNRCKDEEAHL